MGTMHLPANEYCVIPSEYITFWISFTPLDLGYKPTLPPARTRSLQNSKAS